MNLELEPGDKKTRYIQGCLDRLEDVIGDSRKFQFYCNVLNALVVNKEITSSELLDCDPAPEDKKKVIKTYSSWMKQLTTLLEDRKEELWQCCNDEDLKKPPILKVEQGKGGAGNETKYFVDFDAQTDMNFSLAPPSCPKSTLHESHDEQVIYKIKMLKRAPWYLKALNPFFENRKIRTLIILSAGFLRILLLLLVVIVALISHQNYLLIAGYILLFLILSGPAKNIWRLGSKKIVLLEELLMPISAVCISGILKDQKEATSETVKRYLLTAQILGTCPICCKEHHLTESVWLKRKFLWSPRIIGVCSNNPDEHRFSFDKDLMTGQQLR